MSECGRCPHVRRHGLFGMALFLDDDAQAHSLNSARSGLLLSSVALGGSLKGFGVTRGPPESAPPAPRRTGPADVDR